MMVIMAKTGGPLKTAATTSGILNLEFANTKQKVEDVLTAWKLASHTRLDVIASAKLNTGFDFIFLIFYSFFLYCCCKQLSLLLPPKNVMAAWLSKAAPAALLAGILDLIENFGMLRSLSGNVSETVAQATSLAAIIKWLLVVFIVMSIIAGLMVKIMANKKGTVQN
jgi:hypothetical protein